MKSDMKNAQRGELNDQNVQLDIDLGNNHSANTQLPASMPDLCIGYEFEISDVHAFEQQRLDQEQRTPANHSRRVAQSKRVALSTVLPVALVSLHTAVAENSPADRSIDKRFYIGGSLGMSRINPEAFCPCLTVGDESDMGIGLLAGMDISKRFAIEGYYSKLGAASVDFLGDAVGEVDYSVAGLQGVFYFLNLGSSGSVYSDEGYYRREGLSLYAKLGAGLMQNDSNLDYKRNNTAHLSAALGAEYGFQNGLALRAEINSYDTDAQQINASIVKRFGDSKGYTAATKAAPTATPIAAPPKPVVQPPPEPVATPVALPTVYFEFARHNLTETAQAELDGLVNVLQQQRDLNVVLEGHTDWIDTDDYNLSLSTDRAAAVERYLVQNDIAASRISLAGMGESQPVADNTTSEGRAANRRVEVRLE